MIGAVAATLLREKWLLLAVALLAVALVLPPIEAMRPVHRYEVTIDISQSMGTEDVALAGRAASRLALAKAAAAALLRDLPCGSRVGWSVFVEQRTLTLATPLEVCEHYDALLSSLEGIDGRMRWGEASGIGKGLHQSLRAASEIGDDTAVVMISDGEEAAPLRAGQSGLPKDEGLGIHGLLAGVGGERPVPIPRFDEEGRRVGWWQLADVAGNGGIVFRNARTPGSEPMAPADGGPADGVWPLSGGEVLSRLDGEHLADLARLAGLDYAHVARPADLAEALDAAGLARPAPVAVDLRWIPAALALLALLWRFRPDRRRLRLRRRAASA